MWRSPTKTGGAVREGMESPLLQRVNDFVESFHTAATAESDLHAGASDLGEASAGGGDFGEAGSKEAVGANSDGHTASGNPSEEELRTIPCTTVAADDGGEGGVDCEIEDGEAASSTRSHGVAARLQAGAARGSGAAGLAWEHAGGGGGQATAPSWSRAAALVLVLAAIGCWVSEIMVSKVVMATPADAEKNKGGARLVYDQPYAVMWLGHSIQMFMGFGLGTLIDTVFSERLPPPRGRKRRRGGYRDAVLRPKPLYLARAGVMSTLSITCGALWFISIPLTSAVVNTVLYQTSCVWCFIMSVLVLGEKVTLIKAASTLMTFTGVAMIGKWPCVDGDGSLGAANGAGATMGAGGRLGGAQDVDKNATFAGEMLVLLSAFLYAVYEVLLKIFSIPPEPSETGRPKDGRRPPPPLPPPTPLQEALDACAFTGWMGAFNLCILWIPILVMHVKGIHAFELPTPDSLPLVILDATLEGAFGTLLVLAIALSSPLFVTVGTVLAIPTSAVIDSIINGLSCQPQSLVGGGLVVLGFMGVNLAGLTEGLEGWPSWL